MDKDTFCLLLKTNNPDCTGDDPEMMWSVIQRADRGSIHLGNRHFYWRWYFATPADVVRTLDLTVKHIGD